MVNAIMFLFASILLSGAAVFAIFGIVHLYLSSRKAIADDGLPRGAVAPVWSLADSTGTLRCSPPEKPFQLIVFGDHSLRSFPRLIQGLNELLNEASRLEILIMMRRPDDKAEALIHLLGLHSIPIVAGSSVLYGKYNVRVMPFVFFVDSAGRVRTSGLVNTAAQLFGLWRLANLPLGPDELQPHRRWRRLARAGA